MTIEVVAQKLEDHLSYREKMDNLVMEKLDGIIKRQDIANGRLNKSELWQARIVGAWVVLSAIMTGLIIPLTYNYLQANSQIELQVDRSLSEYLEKQ